MKEKQTIFFKLCLADALLNLMKNQNYESINVNTICDKAGIGRTTFYRYFDSKKGKDNLLVFKINYDWEKYWEDYSSKLKAVDDSKKGSALLRFIYERKDFFTLLYNNGLTMAIMEMFETILCGNIPLGNNLSYIASYFTYGYFGIIYQWIKTSFKDTPLQIEKYIGDAFSKSQNNS